MQMLDARVDDLCSLMYLMKDELRAHYFPIIFGLPTALKHTDHGPQPPNVEVQE